MCWQETQEDGRSEAQALQQAHICQGTLEFLSWSSLFWLFLLCFHPFYECYVWTLMIYYDFVMFLSSMFCCVDLLCFACQPLGIFAKVNHNVSCKSQNWSSIWVILGIFVPVHYFCAFFLDLFWAILGILVHVQSCAKVKHDCQNGQFSVLCKYNYYELAKRSINCYASAMVF